MGTPSDLLMENPEIALLFSPNTKVLPLNVRTCECELRKRLKRKMMCSRPFPKLKLRSSYGNLSMRLKLWLELKNLKETSRSLVLESWKLKKPLIPSTLKYQALRRPSIVWMLSLKTFRWNTSALMLLLSSLRRGDATLIRFLGNGKQRLTT